MSNSRVHSAGKGDSPRPVDYKKWSENWDRIFGKKNKKKNSEKKEADHNNDKFRKSDGE